jgi:hypothetical protein
LCFFQQLSGAVFPWASLSSFLPLGCP